VKSLLFALFLVLTGCATRPVPPGGAAAAFSPALPEFDAWSFRGRVSLVRGEEGWHAGMRWIETAGHYRLDLAGPLGQGAVRIDGLVDGHVQLQTADGQRHVARDADALVHSATGWELPVNGLRYWVRGVPAPGAESLLTVDDRGRLAGLEQAGWDIRYTRYETLEGRDWPTRVRLEAADLSVTLVVDEWTFEPPAPGAAP
jgi:outer membrane lipoprotein LolB